MLHGIIDGVTNCYLTVFGLGFHMVKMSSDLAKMFNLQTTANLLFIQLYELFWHGMLFFTSVSETRCQRVQRLPFSQMSLFLSDFLGIASGSPDPVRRLIGDGDSTLNNTRHSSPPRSARSHRSNKSAEHHNSTSTPKKTSMHKSPRDHAPSKLNRTSSSGRRSSSKSPHAHNSTKSSHSQRSTSSKGQRSPSPRSHRSNQSSMTDGKHSHHSSR